MLRADEPVDARSGMRAAQGRGDRNGVDDVAERTESDDQKTCHSCRQSPVINRQSQSSVSVFSPADARQQLPRVVLLGIADNGGAPAIAEDYGALGHRVDRVVGP